MSRPRAGYIGFNRVPAAEAESAPGVWTLREAEAARRDSADPYFSNVSLLLHMDGSGSTFVDSSGTPKTVTANGDATQSTAQSKFGGKSAYFDGNGDSLRIANPATSFGAFSGDFTVECWIRWNQLPPGDGSGNERQIVGQHIWAEAASGNWWCLLGISSGLVFYAAGGGSFEQASAPFGWSTGQWYHVAACRSGGTMRMFVDGAQRGQSAQITKTLFADNTRPLAIGGDSNNVSNMINGYIDELRITKGVARYTGSAFSVPAAPFSNW